MMYVLDTNINGFDVGIVLSQEQDENERVIADYSETLFLRDQKEITASPKEDCWL